MRNVIVNPEILAGKPIFEGTRIPIELVLDLLAQGHTVEEIIKEYPRLTKKDIMGALKIDNHRYPISGKIY